MFTTIFTTVALGFAAYATCELVSQVVGLVREIKEGRKLLRK
jgi:hypothetical protein